MPNVDMLNAFMYEHAYIFNAVGSKFPRPNSAGVEHAELSKYVRNMVTLITKTNSKLAAFETFVTRYVEIRIVPYMVTVDSDDQFWMALDGDFP